MIDAGVESQLSGVLGLIRSTVAGIEFESLAADEAAQVVKECAEAERVLAAARVMAAATLEDKALWRREGFRSAAHWMASKTGTAVGPAIGILEMANQLGGLPLLAHAFRNGLLSEAQARLIAEVASEVPDAEEHLLEAAAKLSLNELREECRRVEAAADANEDDRYRRVHRSRNVRSWTDRHGVARMSARGNPDDIARLLTEIDRRCDDMVADAIRGGWFEGREAHRFDALIDLARPASAEPAGPETMLHVVVDYDALMRGHTVSGEQCEIPGFGPIPVTLARQMSEDSILRVLLTRGVDVTAVAHGGHNIPAHLRSALLIRDRNASCPAATTGGISRWITGRATGGPGSPNSRTSVSSAGGTTT